MTHRAALAFAVTLVSAPAALATSLGLADVPGPLERSRDGAPERLVPGRAILKLDGITGERLQLPRADDSEAQKALPDLAARTGVALELVRPMVLGWALVEVRDATDAARMPDEEETERLIERLASDGAVEAVSADHWYRRLLLPNDPGIPQMWHLEAIGAAAAWDVTRGLSSQRIGVADTGLLRTHEDVGGRAVNGFDFISSASQGNDGNGRDSNFNDAGDSCQGEPSSFHGTHVAGTIGAAANNGKGIAGVNWNAGLVVARVLGRCGGASSDIMEGAAWMAGAQVNGVPNIGADKVSVMNLSLGGANGCSSFEQQVVDFVDAQGAVFVAAAGNDAGPVGSPANCNKAVTVAAHGPTGAKSNYSSFGSSVEIVAPGGDQRFGQGAGVLSATGPGASSYTFQQGTSMAAPHVTGAISLLQAVNASLTRPQIVAALQASGQSCTNCSGKPVLQLPASLAAVGAGSSPPPPPPPPPATTTDDPFEENDTLGQATNASCGVNDNRLVAAPADRDFFTFVPPAGRTIAVAITAANGADLDLYVTNMQGTILARSETSTGNERITGTASGARLGILVNPFVNPNDGTRHSGPYRITITCSAGAQSVGEPGDVVEFTPGEGDEEVVGDGEGVEIGAQPGDEAPIEEPIAGEDGPGEGGPDTGDLEEDDDALPPSTGPMAEGGCTASGASPPALGALVLGLLALLRRRRAR